MFQPLWAIWREVPLLVRLFFTILTAVTIYALTTGSLIVFRASALMRSDNAGVADQLSIRALEARMAKLQQVLGATFYFFGFIFFVTLPFATRPFDDSNMRGDFLIFRNFLTYFSVAANAFFVFLLLHIVQWVAATCIQKLRTSELSRTV